MPQSPGFSLQGGSTGLQEDVSTDRGPIIIGVVSFLWVLTIIATSLRVISKYLSKAKWWWDDYLAIIASVLYSIKSATTVYTVTPKVGGGQHYSMINPSQEIEFLKMQSLQFVLYPMAMGAAKCSVIAFYIRVFGVQRIFRWWCYCLLGLVLAWSISVCLVTVLVCLPAGSAWDITIPGRTCINQPIFFNVSAMLDAVLNFLTLVSPLYLIWQLKLNTKKKIAISAVLMVGAGELVFTIIRIVILLNVVIQDIPWDFFLVFIWTNVQESVAIVCICLPALGPLLKYKAKKSTATQSKHSVSRNSKTQKPMGTVTLCEGALDRSSNSVIPAKESTEGPGGLSAISSFWKEGDQESL